MHQRICDTISKQLPAADLPKNAVFKNEGFLGQSYDGYVKADVTKASMVFNIGQISEKVNDSVEIVSYNASTGTFTDLGLECKTVFDYIMLLRNKKVDVVAYYDSCCVKKAGREIQLMPKLAVHQIIIHDYVQKQHSTIGLRIKNE